MRVRRHVPEPLVERLVVELGKRRKSAVQLLGGDPFDARLDLGAGVGVVRIKTPPILPQVVVTKKLGADGVGQLDHLDAVGGDVLSACVEPYAVRLLERARPPSDIVGRVEHLQVQVTKEIRRGQAGHSAAQHRQVEPLHPPPFPARAQLRPVRSPPMERSRCSGHQRPAGPDVSRQ